MEESFEQADHPVVVELEARHTSLADQRRFGQAREEAGVNGTRQEVSLQGEGTVIGGRQLLAQQGQVLQSAADAEVAGVVGAGFGARDTGRDGAGSNWATYFYDPDGHTNELYYGIEQVGWDGKSKPAEYRRPVREKVQLPVKSEFDEIQESLATTGVPIDAGYRPMELPDVYDVDGILLPRPFKIVKHGPVNLFVEDVARARDFYMQILGLQVTEEASYRGEACCFLRCNTEHHSLGLFPLTLREPLGLSSHTTCASFGIQVANYRHLREAVAFLRAEGVRVETDRVPPELHPRGRLRGLGVRSGGPLHPAVLLHGAGGLGWSHVSGFTAPQSRSDQLARGAGTDGRYVHGRATAGSLGLSTRRDSR
jgi:catechol 2,3-dioxygenase-like lactoylglutathione lyase family enzyme